MSESDQAKPADALNNQAVDYAVAIARTALGTIPICGSPLAELVSVTIPNQRLDRLVKFTRELESRFAVIEDESLRRRLADEEIVGLVEAAYVQAAQGSSDERRAYIASVVVNGINSEELAAIESRHLLKILGEMNDLEVIWLLHFAERQFSRMGDISEFRLKHDAILNPVITLHRIIRGRSKQVCTPKQLSTAPQRARIDR